MPAPSPTRGPLRGSAIHLGLVFPDSQEGTPADPRSWRKGTVGDSSTTYWWRKGVHESDAPEVSSTPPAEDWKVGKLENGREFLWREGNDPDDPEIALQGSEVEATSAPDTSPDGWRIGVLASGRRYLWRGSAEGGTCAVQGCSRGSERGRSACAAAHCDSSRGGSRARGCRGSRCGFGGGQGWQRQWQWGQVALQ